jgi:peroxiredoxin Q/BCP
VFVIDANGRISYAHRALAGLTYRPVEELVSAIQKAAEQ